MKNDISIRVDGDERIGLGHLVRCSALAQMLKDDFKITFFCQLIPTQLESEICSMNIEVVRIKNESDFLNSIEQDEIVVLDGYSFDTDYQRKIKRKQAKLVCIDDLHNIEFVADLILNHGLGVTPQDYIAQPYTKFALGINYALLRPAFLEQIKKERQVDKIETVLICFGGADPKGFTVQTLKIVCEYNKFKTIIIVTGSAFRVDKLLESIVLRDNRIIHLKNLTEKQMLGVMLEAELAILPSSGVLLEALAAGCVVITGYYTDNQKHGAIAVNNLGLAISCGSMLENYRINLREIISSLSIEAINKLLVRRQEYLRYSPFLIKESFKALCNES